MFAPTPVEGRPSAWKWCTTAPRSTFAMLPPRILPLRTPLEPRPPRSPVERTPPFATTPNPPPLRRHATIRPARSFAVPVFPRGCRSGLHGKCSWLRPGGSVLRTVRRRERPLERTPQEIHLGPHLAGRRPLPLRRVGFRSPLDEVLVGEALWSLLESGHEPSQSWCSVLEPDCRAFS